jgi:nucleoid DNA-binding protein
MTYTKAHILKAIRPFVKHKDILNAVFLEINKAMVRREVVMIKHFGTFYVVKSNVKMGRDFKNKQTVALKPQYKIKFHSSNLINKIVNERNII